jgi:hypothetical protein
MAEDRRRDLSFSSEAPVERWFGYEILDHSPSSIRMGFIDSGRAPLLLGHDQRRTIGIIERAAIGKDRIGRATPRFGRSAAATESLQDVDDGILVNTSVGYRVRELRFESSKAEIDTYRVMDWEPLEVSLVGIPADPTVGVGRSISPISAEPVRQTTEVNPASAEAIPEETTATTAATRKGVTRVTTESTAAAGASAEVKAVSAIEADRERREAVSNLCRANGIDSRVEADWINDPHKWTWRAISDQILSIKEERTKHNPTVDNALGLSRSETQKYSLFRAIRHLKNPASPKYREEARFEIECTEALAKRGTERSSESSILIPSEILVRMAMGRAMATQPGSKGGYMVNVENMGFLEILRNRSVAMRMGARSLSGLVGNVMFPRQTGKATVTWQGGEGTASRRPIRRSASCHDAEDGHLRDGRVRAAAAPDEPLRGGLHHGRPRGLRRHRRRRRCRDQRHGRCTAAGHQEHDRHHVRPGRGDVHVRQGPRLPVSTAGALNAIRGNPGFVTNTAGASKLMQRSASRRRTPRSGPATCSTAARRLQRDEFRAARVRRI